MNARIVIDFAAARKRIENIADQRGTYLDVEFTADELAPVSKPTLLDMLNRCTDEVGLFGVREELLK